MYRKISELILYGNIKEDEILAQLGEIFRRFDEKKYDRAQLTKDIFTQVKRLLELATAFGFDENLWQNYLTFLLITNENPFSLTCEKVGASDGSVNYFALNDCIVFRDLFFYDFGPIEEALDISCFSVLCDYKAIEKKEFLYNQNVSRKVRALCKQLADTENEKEFFEVLTDFYRRIGVGMFGLNKAFRLEDELEDGRVVFRPINNMDNVLLTDLIGYEIQKQKLVSNTRAFVKGLKANNVLLFGDSGTGKSTSIKAIVNEFYDDGLRMIEIYKHQFKDLSKVIAQIKNRNYKFIIYMDDLSFEDFEIEYKFLKAVIEGGVETKPDNILIYATSNRRHLIKENWKDRNDMEHTNDIHRSDTMEEKLSLVHRFGETIFFGKPTQKEYFKIVQELAAKQGLEFDENEINQKANAWELSHGGISGRTAQQFVNYLLGQNNL